MGRAARDVGDAAGMSTAIVWVSRLVGMDDLGRRMTPWPTLADD
jgi:hypothetical protein